METSASVGLEEIKALLADARRIAIRYYSLTGRPLGITGEIAEFEAVCLLGLKIAPARQAGYDVIRISNGNMERLQVKGRCIRTKNPGQRIGALDIKKEWDGVLLVLLDPNFQVTKIYEAQRTAVVTELSKPGSKARNVRGSLSVNQFKRVAKQVWPLAQ